jgi:hypothetical protein
MRAAENKMQISKKDAAETYTKTLSNSSVSNAKFIRIQEKTMVEVFLQQKEVNFDIDVTRKHSILIERNQETNWKEVYGNVSCTDSSNCVISNSGKIKIYACSRKLNNTEKEFLEVWLENKFSFAISLENIARYPCFESRNYSM